MSRFPQGPAVKGSQKWIQKLVNETPQPLNAEIRKQLTLSTDESISWLSPRAEDDFAEYRDQTFLDLLDLNLTKVPLRDFWPAQGPQWDALGKSESGKVLLVEAKSHILEMLSPGTGAGEKSVQKIKESLDRTKAFLNSKSDRDWLSTFYQYTNRLAHLYLLRELNHIPAYLIFVYFVNDDEMNGPKSIDEWRGAISLMKTYLGIARHRLHKSVAEVFIDVKGLSRGSNR